MDLYEVKANNLEEFEKLVQSKLNAKNDFHEKFMSNYEAEKESERRYYLKDYNEYLVNKHHFIDYSGLFDFFGLGLFASNIGIKKRKKTLNEYVEWRTDVY